LARPGKVFYVLGEVNAPGAFPITGRDTVLSAITQAGGPTRRASEQNIVLSRPTLPDGCRVVFPVCYTNIVQLGDTTTNYQLMPGDRVFVPSKGMFEGLFPGRCEKNPVGACVRPQVPCFGGGCAPVGQAVTPLPALPPQVP
jgi:protein involved in polysaccharide export with SLBB domain